MRLIPEREKEIDEYLSSFTGKKPLMNVTGALREQKKEIDALRIDLRHREDLNDQKCEMILLIEKERDQLREALEKIINGRFHIGNDENGNVFGPPDSVMCRKIAGDAIDACRGDRHIR